MCVQLGVKPPIGLIAIKYDVTLLTLPTVGRAMGDEVTQQNQHIDRIIGKTDKVDDQIAMNRARLDRIK